MSYYKETLYCGPSGANLCSFLGVGKKVEVNGLFDSEHIYLTHKARVAICQACLILGIGEGDEVLAPAYNCGTEIDALMSSGASVLLYRIDKTGRIDCADLQQRITKKTKLVYVTHYFGFPQPLADIKNLCDEKDFYLVEDCALSLFSNNGKTRIGSVGDIAVFNFPKTLPVPDGGALVINNQDLVKSEWIMRATPFTGVFKKIPSLFKQYALSILSGTGPLYHLFWHLLRKRQLVAFAVKPDGENFPDMPSEFYYDERLNNTKMSHITRRMLGTFDVSKIVSRRRDNFLRYTAYLDNSNIAIPLYNELPEGVCPLYFPVIVDKREQVCRELNSLSIGAITWWAGYHQALPWEEYPDACFLKDNLLVLPVHQQLSGLHVMFIIQNLLSIIQKLKG